MQKILLINSNRCKNPYPVFPLGLAFVQASLVQAGHAVQILDLNLPDVSLEQMLREDSFDIVGVSIRNIDDCRMEDSQFLVETDIELVRKVKQYTSAPVVVGGSGFSIFPRKIFEESGADFGIMGEGEKTFPQLVACLESHECFDHLSGLVYRCENEVRLNRKQPVESGGLIPQKDPGLLSYYQESSSMLNIQTQRGCGYQCCYCSYPVIEGRTYRRRDPASIAQELCAMKRQGVRYFFVVDSVFNTSNDHVAGICEEMIRREVGLQWSCFLRPKNLTSELVTLMKRAGLTHVEFGTDSFADTVLNAYGKGFCFDDVYRASELMRANDVHYAHFLIMGGPGESESTMREAFENSTALRKTVVFPFIGMRIFPETPLVQRAIDEGVVGDGDDLFRPVFYVSPQIEVQRIHEVLEEFHRESPRWIIGDLSPQALQIMEKLRGRGVVGPLWEFLAR